jgi:hypothetical protein
LPWDIARFGEDETVGMSREGGWIRLYRATSKADTMTDHGPHRQGPPGHHVDERQGCESKGHGERSCWATCKL